MYFYLGLCYLNFVILVSSCLPQGECFVFMCEMEIAVGSRLGIARMGNLRWASLLYF